MMQKHFEEEKEDIEMVTLDILYLLHFVGGLRRQKTGRVSKEAVTPQLKMRHFLR